MNIPDNILARLKDAAGARGFSEDPSEIAPHLEEWRSKFHGRSNLLLKPDCTEAVAKILSICNSARIAVVPQGGNTGLVGGQIPFHGEIVLSLKRMNTVRSVDPDDFAMVAEAGVILADAQRAAEQKQLLFPLSIAAEGSCTIGGNLSTNAGGVNVLRYGSARDLVLGIEAVLADGRVLDMLKVLRKDNTGYDLKQLFIGAEGTLGVITAASLKLYPQPISRGTVLFAFENLGAAVQAFSRLQHDTGNLLTSFELISRTALELVLKHFPGLRDPFMRPHRWYALAEASSSGMLPMEHVMSESVERMSSHYTDAIPAMNEAQRAAFWALRENISEAQKREGASIKHDISVPVRDIPRFVAEAVPAVEAIVPGARPVTFGHLGDGNLHFNFSVPIGGDDAAFLGHWEAIARKVHDIVHAHAGSISAEHGIGILKREDIVRYKSAAEIETMRALKRALDPNGILNPGKVV
ncbi:MAG: FAD-binding protein [Alphaproteobacteria bacterium]|nr:FAD-binding protein [Alphaproteobacteria bacterium]